MDESQGAAPAQSRPSMCNHFLVRSEHLNGDGDLFGGQLMAELDTVAYCLLREVYPDCQFVTRAASIEFVSPAKLGAVVHFCATRTRVGHTSVEVDVVGEVEDRLLTRAKMTFVRVRDGRSATVPSSVSGRLRRYENGSCTV